MPIAFLRAGWFMENAVRDVPAARAGVVEVEPRHGWEALFRAQGMQNPTPRVQMLDGFNEGWIELEGTPERGTTRIETVLADLVARAT